VQFELCSEGYFQTLGIPLKRGRLLTKGDIDSARRVAVVNQSLARTYFSGEDPIGQRMKFSSFDPLPNYPHDTYFEIVGIVGDVRNRGLRESAAPEAYIPHSAVGAGNRSLLVKTAVDPLFLQPTLRREITAIDPNVAMINAETLESLLRRNSYAQPRFAVFTLGTFAAIGLMLVVGGVFSVMAYRVSLQRQEIGIRMALGAQPRDVLWMLVKKGLGLTTAGILVGLVASLGFTRLLRALLHEVQPLDPATFVAVPVLLSAACLCATYLASWQVTRIDTAAVLRSE